MFCSSTPFGVGGKGGRVIRGLQPPAIVGTAVRVLPYGMERGSLVCGWVVLLGVGRGISSRPRLPRRLRLLAMTCGGDDREGGG